MISPYPSLLANGSGNSIADYRFSLFHKTSSPFQYSEGCMSFIQVAALLLDAEGAEQALSADPEYQLLLETELWTSSIKLACHSSMGLEVRRVNFERSSCS
jgi:hypothetical protein